jgi:hypothetical protein
MTPQFFFFFIFISQSSRAETVIMIDTTHKSMHQCKSILPTKKTVFILIRNYTCFPQCFFQKNKTKKFPQQGAFSLVFCCFCWVGIFFSFSICFLVVLFALLLLLPLLFSFPGEARGGGHRRPKVRDAGRRVLHRWRQQVRPTPSSRTARFSCRRWLWPLLLMTLAPLLLLWLSLVVVVVVVSAVVVSATATAGQPLLKAGGALEPPAKVLGGKISLNYLDQIN